MRGAVLLALMVCVGRAAEVCTGAPVVETVQLPGSPFKLAVSSDGCWIYASMAGKQTGLAILKRSAGSLNVVKTLKTSGPLTGLVLTHDGKMLMGTASQSASLTSGKSVLFIDAAKGAVIHQFDEEAGDGKVYANVTADDKTLFVSNERAHSISVIDVPTRSVIGRIPVGNAPIALTFSPDEKWLYTTSQSATPDWAWPAVCDAENAASVGKHPKGAIVVVDVEIARKDPAHAVTSRVEAGCNPVRLALSPDGGRAYVTARKDNKVLVFETAKFSKIAEIEVG